MAANGGFGSKLPPLSPTNAADIRSDAANTGASVMQSQHFHCAPTAVRRSNPDRSAFAALIATAAVAIASMLPTIVAAQTPGALDANFALGIGKIPAIAMGAGASRGNAALVQPDSRILLFGSCSNGTDDDFCATRLLPDGNTDTTFVGPGGTGNGKVILPIGSGNDVGQAIALRADGKIVLAGHCTAAVASDFCVARLLPDGSYDTTFVGPAGNGAGKFLVSVGATDNAAFVLIQPDSKILVGGQCDMGGATGFDFCVIRLNDDGTLDTTFVGPSGTGNGKVSFPISTGIAGDTPVAAALMSDGRIVIGGTCDSGTTFCAARLNPNGTFDATFAGPGGNGAGRFAFAMTAGPDMASGMEVQPDGKVLLSGTCRGTTNDFCVARLNVGGTLDNTFSGPSGSGAGKVLIDVSDGNDIARTMRLLPDGKIMLAGNCVGGVTLDYCLVRLNGDGTLDSTFDGPTGTGGGKVTFPVGNGSDTIRSLVRQPDGKIVAFGSCTESIENFCVARVHGGPFGYRACSPDIDGDNQVLATIDGLILSRVALGIRGNAVINGISFPAHATRNTWSQIRDYLWSQCGMNVY